MKKFLLTILMTISAISAMAQTISYTDQLVIDIDGTATDPMETTIIVENNGDTYTLSLNRFALDEMLIGDIVVTGITATENNGVKEFETEQMITITASDENEEWMGPDLGELLVNLKGKMNDEKLYCKITLDIGMMINVIFGEDFKVEEEDDNENRNAISYTDQLVIDIDGTATDPMETTIIVENNGDTYTLSLNRFALDEMLIGDIVVTGITATENNGVKEFETEQMITITASDENEEWMGPDLGELLVNLKGKMNDEKLYCKITLDIGMMINVIFGEDFKVEEEDDNENGGYGEDELMASYTGQLAINVNGKKLPEQEVCIKIDNTKDSCYTISLDSLVLVDGEERMPIGDIVISDVAITETDGVKCFETEQNVTITASNDIESWFGPMFGEIHMQVNGKITGEKLFWTAHIDMTEKLGEVIDVVFGEDPDKKEDENDKEEGDSGNEDGKEEGDDGKEEEEVIPQFGINAVNSTWLDEHKDIIAGEPVIGSSSIAFNVISTADLETLKTLEPVFELTEGASIEKIEVAENGDFGITILYRVYYADNKYSKDYTVSFTIQAAKTFESCFSFEHFELDPSGKYYTWYDVIDGSRCNWWASSNEGYKMTNQAKSPGDFPAAVDSTGLDGCCVKLKTCDTGKLGSMAGMPIAAGSIFIGEFLGENAMKKPLEATRFGLGIAKSRPISLKGSYKYKSGEVFTDKKKNVVEGRKDSCSIYAVLYEVDLDSVVTLNGADVTTSERIVLLAELYAGENDGWQEFSIPFEPKNGKSFDYNKLNSGEYLFTIVASSSKNGGFFEGAVGSTLYIDEVKVEWEDNASGDNDDDSTEDDGKEEDKEEGDKEEEEEDVVEVVTSYTQQLIATVGNTQTKPQEATITVKNRKDKYTFELGKLILVDGKDKMPIGNIVVKEITMTATEIDSIKEFETVQDITITAGDNKENWLGPIVGEVTVTLKGKMTASRLYCIMDIDMTESLGQTISIVFGQDIKEDPVKVYTNTLKTSLGGVALNEQQASIVIEEKDSTYTLSLNSFKLIEGKDTTCFGNIVIEDIIMTEKDGVKRFEAKREITVTAADEKEEWIGVDLGEIAVTVYGEIADKQLSCTLDIDVTEMWGMKISLVFGNGAGNSEDEDEKSRSYTDQLVIDINGEVTDPQEATITVDNNSGTYSLSLKRFSLDGMPIGDIVVTGITATANNGIKEFETEQKITITASDETEEWMGPMLGELPVSLKGKMTSKQLYCTIVLDLEGIGLINVVFGKEITAEEETAINYTDMLVIDINGTETEPQEATIAVEGSNGTYTLSLKRFSLDGMPIGDIVVTDITATENNGVKEFEAEQKITITASDENEEWMGPMLGELPVSLKGKMTAEKLYCTIVLDLEGIGLINVVFGEDIKAGIENISCEMKTIIFDLNGKVVNDVTAPGIYIINGKKYLVK